MKIKEVALNEIYWSIKSWNVEQQANDYLKKKLGDTSRYFAKCNVGHGYYSWDTEVIADWKPKNEASTTEEPLIAQKLGEVSTEVHAKLSAEPDLAEHILEIPNEAYIFYKITPDGQVDIIITGWGFRNFKKTPPVQIKTPPKKPIHPTTIAFAIDDEKLPNRPFTIKASWTQKPNMATTDAEGNFVIKEEEGVSIEVIDQVTQKSFSFVVTNEKSEHIFDLTERTDLTVMATLDGEPLNGETVSIDYAGKHYEETLVDGKALFSAITLRTGEPLKAVLRDETKETILSADNNVVHFEFVTPEEPVEEPVVEEEPPVEEPPAPVTARLTVVDAAGQPIKGAAFSLRQGDMACDGQLDDQGSTLFVVDGFMTSQPLTLTLTTDKGPMEPIEFSLDEGETEYLLQENAPKKESRAGEILLAILMLAALAGIAWLFREGIWELSKIISKNLF